MPETYVVAVEGISALKSFNELPLQIVTAARQAVNKTTNHARAAGAREIRQQINLPARYLSGRDGRLRVKKLAKGDDLEGIVAGRQRPTSLAQFIVGSGKSKSGVRVQVAPGSTKVIPRAFLIKLRAGTSDIDTRFNLGLALRLRPGESVHNKRQMVKLKGNLYLLYGPSVDQVFRTVAEDIAGDEAKFLENEFLRLIDLRAA